MKTYMHIKTGIQRCRLGKPGQSKGAKMGTTVIEYLKTFKKATIVAK